MHIHPTTAFTAVTILREGNLETFKELFDLIIRERSVKKYIVGCNSKEYKEELIFLQRMYKEKLILILGEHTPAQLLHLMFSEAKKYPCDYVIMLEDDAVPEENWIHNYLNNLKYFTKSERDRVVMIGNTVDILGHEKSYYKSVELEQFDDTTLFKIISLKKVLAYLRHLFQIHKKVQLPPIFRIPASVGGATCIPFALVEKAQLPDSTLVEFGEDTDYAWNLKESGALFFKCLSPVFRKVTKQNDVNKTFSVLSKDRAEEEVYLQTRNSIAISRKHSDQMSAILFVNILLKNTILILLLTKKLPHVFFILKRARTIIRGTVTGYSIKLN